MMSTPASAKQQNFDRGQVALGGAEFVADVDGWPALRRAGVRVRGCAWRRPDCESGQDWVLGQA